MHIDFSKVIDHKAVVPGLIGLSVFSVGVAAGVVLERLVNRDKPEAHILAEPKGDPRLFDVGDIPGPERVVITLEEAISMQKAEESDAPKLWSDIEVPVDGDGEPIKFVDRILEAHGFPRENLEEETEAAEYYEPPNHIPEVLLEKTASAGAPVPFNVLDAARDDEVVSEWNWDKEVAYREGNPDGPYPIHEDEYASGSANFHIQELRYYGVDQIVCEELDPRAMMYDYGLKLGDVKFGYGAHDKDVAFIRNPKHRTDYQVTQMHDSYSESVMGIVADDEADQAELAHMDRPLRMRLRE